MSKSNPYLKASAKGVSFMFSKFFWYVVLAFFIWLKWDSISAWFRNLGYGSITNASANYDPNQNRDSRKRSDSEISALADELENAMRGAGTNEYAVLDILSSLNNEDKNYLNYVFGKRDSTIYGDGLTLGFFLKSEFSGDDLSLIRQYVAGTNIYIP